MGGRRHKLIGIVHCAESALDLIANKDYARREIAAREFVLEGVSDALGRQLARAAGANEACDGGAQELVRYHGTHAKTSAAALVFVEMEMPATAMSLRADDIHCFAERGRV